MDPASTRVGTRIYLDIPGAEAAMTTTEPRPDISVVIPCYNEEKNLERGVLSEVYEYLDQQAYAWEVIIINDESTDGSRALIERFIEDKEGFSLYDIPHGGKPAAVWAGVEKARGDVVLFTDMDQSTPIRELAKLLPWYEQGYDVVIGSRGMTREGFSLLRKVGSVVFRTLRSLFLLRQISDTQCGFKSCAREVALDVFPRLQFFTQERPTGWKVSAYDVELLYLCERAGYRIKEVVVEWSNRDESETKGQGGELARYFNESIDMAREVIRVQVNQLKGLYDES
jgi:glycosyltransferase involved in cell wall biosynthesis